jgi:AcrR family transcriptional regulator
MTRRQEHRKARTEAIELGALRLVRSDGLDNLTMPRLAKEVGGAVGALYRYFASKEELLVALQLRALDAFDRLLTEQLAARAEAPAVDQLRTAMHAWGRFAEVEPELHELLSLSTFHPRTLLDDEGAAKVAVRFAPIVGRCVQLLQGAVAEGSLRPGDPEARVWILWGAVSGIGQLRKQDHRRSEHLGADALLEQALDTLLAGWGSEPLHA